MKTKVKEMSDAKYKKRAITQWNTDPCSAHYSSYPIGSNEFFADLENFKYYEYAPWMLTAIGLDKFKNKNVLDLGCGIGLDAGQFEKRGNHVTGTDLSSHSLSVAKKRILSGNLVCSDAENLPFRNECFDVVYSFGVLHHVPRINKAIDEIHRVLNHDGKAIVMLYNRNSIVFLVDLIIITGIIRGNLFRQSVEELLSKNVEYSSIDARPLVKCFNKKQAFNLFYKFKYVDVGVYHLRRSNIPLVGKHLPQRLLKTLSRNFGWFLLIKATKGYGR
jgi:ubiquinone/menaquinone biosynthesis C-methylase UbiE